MVPAFAVADRIYTASLRSIRGERLGRFTLRRGDRPGHCWEWLANPWPDEMVFMVPDSVGRGADASVGETYALEPEIHPLTEPAGAAAVFRDADRLYELHRLDGHEQRLGALAVTPTRLTWVEQGTGGFHALAPALIRFTPRDALDVAAAPTRLLVQTRLRPSLSIEPVRWPDHRTMGR